LQQTHIGLRFVADKIMPVTGSTKSKRTLRSWQKIALCCKTSQVSMILRAYHTEVKR